MPDNDEHDTAVTGDFIPLHLDTNGLYIILTEQGVPDKWHWGLCLHRTGASGWMFHIIRPNGQDWLYDHRTSNTVVVSQRVTAALQVASIPPDMHDAFRKRLGITKSGVKMEFTDRYGELTCRTWLLRALQELDDEGYISIKAGSRVEDVEREGNDLACHTYMAAEIKKRRLGSFNRVFKSNHCILN